MSKYGPLKRGDAREDGMIFWAYYRNNKEQWFSKQKYEDKKKKHSESSKKIFYKNREKCNSLSRLYYRKNRESQLILAKKRYYKNLEKRRDYARKYGKLHRDQISNNCKKRRKVDHLYKFKKSIRSLIISTFKSRYYKKESKTTEILGCSIKEFKSYIEHQFLPGMNWENRSQWHLDHIMPVSMAKTYDELLRLNHYKNFRPLWAKDNMVKSDKKIDTLVLF